MLVNINIPSIRDIQYGKLYNVYIYGQFDILIVLSLYELNSHIAELIPISQIFFSNIVVFVRFFFATTVRAPVVYSQILRSQRQRLRYRNSQNR